MQGIPERCLFQSSFQVKRLSTDGPGRSRQLQSRPLPALSGQRPGNPLSTELSAEYGQRFGISIPEWRVLAHLSQHERISVREIYLRVQMDKTKFSRAAACLERAGLIEKAVPKDDRRLVALSPTREGRALFSRIAPLALDFERCFFGKLSDEEAAEFRRLVHKLLGEAACQSGDGSKGRNRAGHPVRRPLAHRCAVRAFLQPVIGPPALTRRLLRKTIQ
jgi:DNA-binding MarR family transcriptional regulator